MRGPTPYSTYVYQTPRAGSTVFSIVLRLRTLGSCALHMCLVAAGCIDAHYSQGISVWDIAAGWLIVREAGGVVLDTAGLVLVMAVSCTLCFVAMFPSFFLYSLFPFLLSYLSCRMVK